jgi:hypothetical protein
MLAKSTEELRMGSPATKTGPVPVRAHARPKPHAVPAMFDARRRLDMIARETERLARTIDDVYESDEDADGRAAKRSSVPLEADDEDGIDDAGEADGDEQNKVDDDDEQVEEDASDAERDGTQAPRPGMPEIEESQAHVSPY